MNTIDVPREDCVALELITQDEQIEPQDAGLNDNLEASAKNFSDELKNALSENPNLEIKDGVLRVKAENSLVRANIGEFLALLQEAA